MTTRLKGATDSSSLENVLRRDRLIVFVGLSIVVLLAAAYTVAGVGMRMSAFTMTRMAIDMPDMMMQPTSWSLSYALLVFVMWSVMMIAMMVPSAAPAILLYAQISRKRSYPNRPYRATMSFVAGYLTVWVGFSLLATLLQWSLESIGTVSGMMQIASDPVAGLVLIAAGVYQITPLKSACLRHCQHPLVFLLHHWKPGFLGALRMGAENGWYCLGCCWFLMALLFVGGIMNILWIAGIAVYVGVEKAAAGRRWVTTAAGLILTTSGLWLLVRQALSG